MINRSFYSKDISSFLQESKDEILGQLSANNQFELTLEQKGAWIEQIEILHAVLESFIGGRVLFEYKIPRMGKRCDVVILYKDIVFVLEFKCGSSRYDRASINQAVDYALDLKNFHLQSHELKIVPILVATKANHENVNIDFAKDKICKPILSNGSNLDEIITATVGEGAEINAEQWEESEYRPTPTIIEAAKVLYSDHSVEDISRNDATAINLKATSDRVNSIIRDSQRKKRKSICFITGVPGAGKTLAGLNIANGLLDSGKLTNSTFLSGNGPLVAVLRRALAQDRKLRFGETLSQAERVTETFIQNIHHFRDDHLDEERIPSENVVIFDEAQRAWNKEQASDFMARKRGLRDFNKSEPEFLISVMNRLPEWAVIVCLVGGGQEINKGEAGLPEWLKAIKHYEDWDCYVSSEIENQISYTKGQSVSELLERKFHSEHSLHLGVSMRSFRSEKVSHFVNSLIGNDSESASLQYEEVAKSYPIVLTRNIEIAKAWVKNKRRGSERIGILASSSAKRLAPYGIQINLESKPEQWFLAGDDDIRSSNFLEFPASQFIVQGLELDWVIVGWDGDLRYNDVNWSHYDFKGTAWQKMRKLEKQVYLENTYRVLLTRARQGLIIFIPEGDDSDFTRKHEYYDETYKYLLNCGLEEIS